MPFIIDGHNLIPKIPGLNLSEMDDEMRLVEMLQEYCRLTRKQAEVFFDNAQPGQPRARNFGSVVARFVRSGQTADQAIRDKLQRLGGEARNWTVVSSDHQVQASARAARAAVVPSETFSRQMREILNSSPKTSEAADKGLSTDEVDDWMKIFGIDQEKNSD
jgi:predicted RNA-binding protein with PIN domain